MRVTLPLLRIPPSRAPILRYGVAVLSTALALIPTVLLADVPKAGSPSSAWPSWSAPGTADGSLALSQPLSR